MRGWCILALGVLAIAATMVLGCLRDFEKVPYPDGGAGAGVGGAGAGAGGGGAGGGGGSGGAGAGGA